MPRPDLTVLVGAVAVVSAIVLLKAQESTEPPPPTTPPYPPPSGGCTIPEFRWSPWDNQCHHAPMCDSDSQMYDPCTYSCVPYNPRTVPPVCVMGQYYDTCLNKCTAIPACPSGFVYNPSLRVCETAPAPSALSIGSVANLRIVSLT